MPRKILHVLGSMNRGGVETWLMHVFRNIDRSAFKMDVVVHSAQPAAYDDELNFLGVSIIHCAFPSRPLTYARTLSRLLKEHGPYDVVHSHVHHYSGFILRVAYKAGVPIRIAHSHNDTRPALAEASLPRRCYSALTKRLIARYATRGLAASNLAAESLFGPDWKLDSRWKTLYYGIDLSEMRAPVDATGMRRELGIPNGAYVVGHVGRFNEQKNHKFILEIAKELSSIDADIFFLLVGDGPLRPKMESLVQQAGLSKRFRFALVRSDVPQLMKGCMDLFLFPSLYEGLGLVLVEAQAAGLPCLCSDIIPSEANVVRELVRRLPLSSSARDWGQAILERKSGNRMMEPTTALQTVMRSRFNLQERLADLAAEYATNY
jgi:glycosyltransferase involved in cell wall biosynthesis